MKKCPGCVRAYSDFVDRCPACKTALGNGNKAQAARASSSGQTQAQITSAKGEQAKGTTGSTFTL